MIPRKIFALWLQGEQQAPALVQMCLRRWRRLNPDYELQVFDAASVRSLLSGVTANVNKIEPQALSDILRLRLMRDYGGVWIDATVFPITPLDSWLTEAADSGFFAFEGHRRPIDIDSWFLAAEPGHIIAEQWSSEAEAYWHQNRKLITFEGHWSTNYNFDPISFFGPAEAESSDSYPYFWVMFLFTHLLNTNQAMVSAWDGVPRVSSHDAHIINQLCDANPDISDEELVAASRATNVQKLSFKSPHARRWLTLDHAFHNLDRERDLDWSAYPLFDPNVPEYRWYNQVRSRVSTRVRAKGSEIIRVISQ